MYSFELLCDDNSYLLDSDLSLSAKALLTLSLVFTNIDNDTLYSTNNNSIEEINKALDELVKFNYVKHNNNELSFYASVFHTMN